MVDATAVGLTNAAARRSAWPTVGVRLSRRVAQHVSGFCPASSYAACPQDIPSNPALSAGRYDRLGSLPAHREKQTSQRP
jgi:hypothetical protein